MIQARAWQWLGCIAKAPSTQESPMEPHQRIIVRVVKALTSVAGRPAEPSPSHLEGNERMTESLR